MFWALHALCASSPACVLGFLFPILPFLSPCLFPALFFPILFFPCTSFFLPLFYPCAFFPLRFSPMPKQKTPPVLPGAANIVAVVRAVKMDFLDGTRFFPHTFFPCTPLSPYSFSLYFFFPCFFPCRLPLPVLLVPYVETKNAPCRFYELPQLVRTVQKTPM